MMKKSAKFFLEIILSSVSFVYFCGGCGTALPGTTTSLFGGQSSTTTPQQDQMAQEVLTLTNQERAKVGLSPLTWNDTLAGIGANHCQDMIDRNYFAHESPEGQGPSDRADAAGYQWSWIGENIAFGYSSASTVMTGWMNSPGHKANILRPEFTELGVGIRQTGNSQLYWAQEFGTP
jgi:uncharacterized protein YkwD